MPSASRRHASSTSGPSFFKKAFDVMTVLMPVQFITCSRLARPTVQLIITGEQRANMTPMTTRPTPAAAGIITPTRPPSHLAGFAIRKFAKRIATRSARSYVMTPDESSPTATAPPMRLALRMKASARLGSGASSRVEGLDFSCHSFGAGRPLLPDPAPTPVVDVLLLKRPAAICTTDATVESSTILASASYSSSSQPRSSLSWMLSKPRSKDKL
mmetsp:Transcript_106017/g.298072  ORF Transcript_106017/g.298072 Transcript_106017/m.298072 type:complete len:215 (+) Transcript_106017:874-1518(+)